jgi:hypothetical protein
LLEQTQVERIDRILSSFSCPKNTDVEGFLHNNALGFAQQGIAQTHLIIGERDELLGFFTLALKVPQIHVSALNKTYEKRVSKFGVLTDDVYAIPMPLIAQLGRNYNPSLQGSISGDELLEIACDKVCELQMEMGGRFVYLECEDIPYLTEFYASNGFRRVSPEDMPEGELVRMIRYL